LLLLAELRQTRSEQGEPRQLPDEQHASAEAHLRLLDTRLDRLPTLYWGDSRQLERVGTTTRNIRLGGDAPDSVLCGPDGVKQPVDTARYRGRTPNTYNIQFWVYKHCTGVSTVKAVTRCE
jgi:hypothetical protein